MFTEKDLTSQKTLINQDDPIFIRNPDLGLLSFLVTSLSSNYKVMTNEMCMTDYLCAGILLPWAKNLHCLNVALLCFDILLSVAHGNILKFCFLAAMATLWKQPAWLE